LKKLTNENKSLMLTMISGWLSRAVIVIATLANIRIVSTALSSEHYALYVVLVSLLPIFTLSDLGQGQILQNSISAGRVNNKQSELNFLYPAVIVFVASTVCMILAFFLGSSVSEFFFHNYQHISIADKYWSLIYICGIGLSTSFFTLMYKIWYAEHKGYFVNVALAISSLLAVSGTFILQYFFRSSSLIDYLLIANLPMLLVPAILGLSRFFQLFSLLNVIKIKQVIHNFKGGLGFWLFNLTIVVALHFDFLILAKFVGTTEVIVYFVLHRFFGLAIQIYTAPLLAIWPVFSESYESRNFQKIRLILGKAIILVCLFSVLFTATFMIVGNIVVDFIMPTQKIEFSPMLACLFGTYLLVRSLSDIGSVFLQSIGQKTDLLKWTFLQAIIGIALQLALVQFYGIYGIILGLILGCSTTVLWAYPRVAWRIIR
jgi:O-antigen/teichoic acid export membrane protein